METQRCSPGCIHILQGIDFNGGRTLVGTCHTDAIIAETLAGFAAAVRAVQDNGLE
jgi:hypothetical protein